MTLAEVNKMEQVYNAYNASQGGETPFLHLIMGMQMRALDPAFCDAIEAAIDTDPTDLTKEECDEALLSMVALLKESIKLTVGGN